MPPTEPAPSATPEASQNSGQQLASELVAAKAEQPVATAETVVSATPVAEYKQPTEVLDPLAAAADDAAKESIHYEGRGDQSETSPQSSGGTRKPGKIATAIAAGVTLFGSLFMMSRSSNHDAQPAPTSPVPTAPVSPPAQPTAGAAEAVTPAPTTAVSTPETPAANTANSAYIGAHGAYVPPNKPNPAGGSMPINSGSGEVGPAVQFNNGTSSQSTTSTSEAPPPPNSTTSTTVTPSNPESGPGQTS